MSETAAALRGPPQESAATRALRGLQTVSGGERRARALLAEISPRMGWAAARMDLWVEGVRQVLWHVEPGSDLRQLTAEAAGRRRRDPAVLDLPGGPDTFRILDGARLVAIVEGFSSTGGTDPAARELVAELCAGIGPILCGGPAAVAPAPPENDPLTGLEGRPRFLARLDKAVERALNSPKVAVALMLLDIDRFKAFNATLGHGIGDELLRRIARRIEEAVRPAGMAARLGGDEFAVLFERVHDPGAALRAAERVQDALRQPFVIEGHEVYATAAMGLAFGDSSHQRGDQLLRDAGVAIARAKTAGPGGRLIFERGMQAETEGQLTLEHALREALQRNELVAHFQPVLALSTRRTVGFEALARWHHPKLGWIPPVRFIPAAERAGLIGEVGMAILRSACAGMRLLQMGSPEPLSLSVNLSALQLLDPSLIYRVTQALTASGLDPAQLRIEVTESVLVRQFEAAAAVLEALRKLKVRITMDDFGTGYSSISYLHRLPVDVLKIDSSFVAALEGSEKAAGIVAAIVVLAKNLGLELIAEGVETATQEETLRRLGCEHAQGFRFAQALPLEEACAFLTRGERPGRSAP